MVSRAKHTPRFTVFLYIAAWYGASLGCLILNKVILSELGATRAQLGLCQMVASRSWVWTLRIDASR